MDKIPDFILGVRALLPGIIVATIFYLYSNTRFDQFFFIVFCVICVVIIGPIVEIVVFLSSYFATIIRSFLRMLGSLVGRILRIPSEFSGWWKLFVDTPLAPIARSLPIGGRFFAEVLVAVLLGLLLVKTYENDLTFRIMSRFIQTEKISVKDVFDFVSDNIAKKSWDRIDQRPPNRKFCKVNDSKCVDDVYVRIRFKGESDVYEGAFVYYQSSGERAGMYLSPACVRRRMEQGKIGSLEVIPGPGVYVTLPEALSVEYFSIRDSECFRLFYPTF